MKKIHILRFQADPQSLWSAESYISLIGIISETIFLVNY